MKRIRMLLATLPARLHIAGWRRRRKAVAAQDEDNFLQWLDQVSKSD